MLTTLIHGQCANSNNNNNFSDSFTFLIINVVLKNARTSSHWKVDDLWDYEKRQLNIILSLVVYSAAGQ